MWYRSNNCASNTNVFYNQTSKKVSSQSEQRVDPIANVILPTPFELQHTEENLTYLCIEKCQHHCYYTRHALAVPDLVVVIGIGLQDFEQRALPISQSKINK